VHEFEVQNRPDLRKTFAYATVPAGHYPDPDNPNGIRDARGLGDFRLIDITDPRNPVMTSSCTRDDPDPDDSPRIRARLKDVELAEVSGSDLLAEGG
jgi:hypothetical protein